MNALATAAKDAARFHVIVWCELFSNCCIHHTDQDVYFVPVVTREGEIGNVQESVEAQTIPSFVFLLAQNPTSLSTRGVDS